jgi:nucleoside-diphosphate-sugar epimerase
MNVFITGASGHAGYYAAIALRQAGHRVTALLRNTGSKRAHALRANEVQVIGGDLKDPDSYRQTLSGSEAIVHTVADHDDPQGTDCVLFETLRTLGPAPLQHRQLVYTTGCSIYGKVPPRVMDETTPGNPGHALAYRMRLEEEALALPNLSTVVVRPGFMYGNDGQSSMSGRWFAMGEAGAVTYQGDPEKGWSWVHVTDLADAYVRIVEGGRAMGNEIFCLADEQRLQCLEVMTACARTAGFTGQVQLAPADPQDWTSVVFDQNEFITSAKARRRLGWMPHHPGILDDLPAYYQAWKQAQ